MAYILPSVSIRRQRVFIYNFMAIRIEQVRLPICPLTIYGILKEDVARSILSTSAQNDYDEILTLRQCQISLSKIFQIFL